MKDFKKKMNNEFNQQKANGAPSPEQEAPEAVVVDDINSTPAEDEMAQEQVAEAADAELSAEQKLEKEKEELAAQVEKEKKEYMFLMAEFDNFRKRTLREKSELIKNAAESVFKGLLPVVDDMERALKASENSEDADSIRQGMELIYKKLKKFMEQNGVKEMDPENKDFDADNHEAITAVPVPDESMKGKIIDTVEKGYTINGKVLRHAKVVVGQ
ncbi:MAG: nucleotide exchange factor GrpE [Muribaculaceae bacterium]|nr:nucleotide exchange factor GrpE [Muribaculaceae bacterium]